MAALAVRRSDEFGQRTSRSWPIRRLGTPKCQAVDLPHNLSAGAYMTGEVYAITGVTFRQLTYWDERGLISPSIARHGGSGQPRLYSYADLLVVATTKALLDDGASLHAAAGQARAVAVLADHPPSSIRGAYLVGSTGDGVLAWSADEVAELMLCASGVQHVVALGPVLAHVVALRPRRGR